MLEAEKSFRRLKAHKQLPILRAALLRRQEALLGDQPLPARIWRYLLLVAEPPRRDGVILQTAVDPMMRQHPRLQPRVQGGPEPQTRALTQSRTPVYYEPPAEPDPSLEPDTLDTATQPGQ
ncbi:hypothetical protein [Bradyrhizobium cenepequi]